MGKLVKKILTCIICSLCITTSITMHGLQRAGMAAVGAGRRIGGVAGAPKPIPKPLQPPSRGQPPRSGKSQIPSGKPKTGAAGAVSSTEAPGGISERFEGREESVSAQREREKSAAKLSENIALLDTLLKNPPENNLIASGNDLVKSLFNNQEVEKVFKNTLAQAKENGQKIILISDNATETIELLLKLAKIDPQEIDSKIFQWQTLKSYDVDLGYFILLSDKSIILFQKTFPDIKDIDSIMIKGVSPQPSVLAPILPSLVEEIPADIIAKTMNDATGEKLLKNGINDLEQSIQNAKNATTALKEQLPDFKDLLQKASDIGIDLRRQKQLQDEIIQLETHDILPAHETAGISESFSELKQDVIEAEQRVAERAKELAQKELPEKVISEKEIEFGKKAAEKSLPLKRNKEKLLKEINESLFLTLEEKAQYKKQLNQKLFTQKKLETIKKDFETKKFESLVAEMLENGYDPKYIDIVHEIASTMNVSELEVFNLNLDKELLDRLEEADLRKDIDKLSKKLEDINKEIETIEQQKSAQEASQQEIQQLEKQHAELVQKQIQTQADHQAAMNNLQKELATQEAQLNAQEKLDALTFQNRMEEIKQQKEDALKKISEKTAGKVKELDEQLAALERKYTEITQLRQAQQKRLEEAQRDLQQAIQAENDAIRQKAELIRNEAQKNLDAKKADLLRAETNVAKKKADLELADQEATKTKAASNKATEEAAIKSKEKEELERVKQQTERELTELKQKEQQETAIRKKEAELKIIQEQEAKLEKELAEKEASERAVQQAATKALAEKEAAEIAAKNAENERAAKQSVAKQAETNLVQQQRRLHELMREQEQLAREQLREIPKIPIPIPILLGGGQEEEEKEKAEEQLQPEQAVPEKKKEKTKPSRPSKEKPKVPVIAVPTEPITAPTIQPEKEIEKPVIIPPSQVIPSPEQGVMPPTPVYIAPPTGPQYPQPGTAYRPPTPSTPQPSEAIPTAPTGYEGYAPAPEAITTTPTTTTEFPTGYRPVERITIAKPPSPTVTKEIEESALAKEEQAKPLTLWERLLQAVKTGLPSRETVQNFLNWVKKNVTGGMEKTPEITSPTEETVPTAQEPEEIPQPTESPTVTFIKSIPTEIGKVVTNAFDYMKKLFGY